MDQLNLTFWQRRRLEDQLRQARTARLFRRTLAVLEVSRGKSVAEIADTLLTSRRSVYRWIEAYCEDHDPKALCEGEHPGRPSVWDEENEAILRYLMERGPEEYGYYAVNWTSPLLEEQMEGSTGQPFSKDLVREGLHRLGYVWKRGRYQFPPDPDLEKKTQHSPQNPQFAASDGVAGAGRDGPVVVSSTARRVGAEGGASERADFGEECSAGGLRSDEPPQWRTVLAEPASSKSGRLSGVLGVLA